MMRLKIEYDLLEFDADAYKNAILAKMKQIMREAAAKFAAAALRRIPVRTGFVAGAFANLANIMGKDAAFHPPTLAIRRQINRSLAQEYYYSSGGKTLKSPESGQKFATQPSEIIRREGNIFRFRFRVDISYFQIQDTGSGNSPTAPWGAFEAGRDAFLRYMREQGLVQFPELSKFIKKRRIKAG